MEDPQQLSSRPPIDWAMILVWAILIAFLALSAWLISLKPAPTTIIVPVPRADLAAYHLLKATDLVTKALDAESIPENAVGALSGLIGQYTLAPLSANEPITAGQVHTVSDPAFISSTVSVGIPATPAMVMGGSLQAGDVVDILPMPGNAGTAPGSTASLFDNILVLDVRLASTSEVEDGADNQPFVVIIALPTARRLEFAKASAGATLLISRKP